MINKRLQKLLKNWNNMYGESKFCVSDSSYRRSDIQKLLEEGYIQKVLFCIPDISLQGEKWSLEVQLTNQGRNYKEKVNEELFDKWWNRLSKLVPKIKIGR